MQRLVAHVFVVYLITIGSVASAQTPPPQPPAAKPPVAKPTAAPPAEAAKNDFIVGDPVRYKNLTIFPVSSRTPRNENRYLTLEEGLKAGTVEVYEMGSQPSSGTAAASRANHAGTRQAANSDPFGGNDDDGADVNRLALLNKSDKPLYLMPGEIIYGGQQDRTIAVEAIIPPGKKPVSIDVFCVEQGRWAARDTAQTADALKVLAKNVGNSVETKSWNDKAEEAKHGKFVAHAGSLSNKARAAVQGAQDQGEVWKKVAETNSAASNKSQSSDFVANYSDPEAAKQLQPYVDAANTRVASGKQVVGAIVAINGSVEAVDVFQSTPLFQKLWPKLLKAHALDALDAADDKNAAKQATVDDARKFLADAMNAGVAKKSDSPGGLVVTKRDSERVMSFSAGMGGMGGMGGGFFGGGDAVHSSGYKK